MTEDSPKTSPEALRGAAEKTLVGGAEAAERLSKKQTVGRTIFNSRLSPETRAKLLTAAGLRPRKKRKKARGRKKRGFETQHRVKREYWKWHTLRERNTMGVTRAQWRAHPVHNYLRRGEDYHLAVLKIRKEDPVNFWNILVYQVLDDSWKRHVHGLTSQAVEEGLIKVWWDGAEEFLIHEGYATRRNPVPTKRVGLRAFKDRREIWRDVPEEYRRSA